MPTHRRFYDFSVTLACENTLRDIVSKLSKLLIDNHEGIYIDMIDKLQQPEVIKLTSYSQQSVIKVCRTNNFWITSVQVIQ